MYWPEYNFEVATEVEDSLRICVSNYLINNIVVHMRKDQKEFVDFIAHALPQVPPKQNIHRVRQKKGLGWGFIRRKKGEQEREYTKWDSKMIPKLFWELGSTG